MGRRVIPHWNDWRMLVGIPLAWTLLTAAIISSVLPVIQRFRASETQAAMTVTPAPIDGERAYGYLKKICELGPRIAGTEANERQRKMVAEHFTKTGGKVTEQHFEHPHPLTGRRVHMVNLIGAWHPERLHRVLISAHYDTRPRADQEHDLDRVNKPFIGANDCASGVALLMEIANHLDKLETPWGVDLVLFDGEELVYGNNAPHDLYFLGSRAFARRYAEARRAPGPRVQYHAGILLDMIGGKDLVIEREQNSVEHAPDLVREIWAVARQLDSKVFSNQRGVEVSDDHLPLNQYGIPTVDLIEFPWRYWHTIDDVPENCSAESLAEVGRVLTGWLSLPRRARR
jgi:glutaminyl-peptide cyclotransferase